MVGVCSHSGLLSAAFIPSDDKPHHWWAKWLLQLHRRQEALCDVQRAALPPRCLVSRKGRGEPAAQNSARTLPLAHSTGGREAKAGLVQQDRLIWLPSPTGQANGEPASWVWCYFYRAILQRPAETEKSMVKILHEIPKFPLLAFGSRREGGSKAAFRCQQKDPGEET